MHREASARVRPQRWMPVVCERGALLHVAGRPAARPRHRRIPVATGYPFTATGYPFTDPAVSPCTMYFWKISTSSTAGSAPRKPEAAITE
jgi:hypothetical protein